MCKAIVNVVAVCWLRACSQPHQAGGVLGYGLRAMPPNSSTSGGMCPPGPVSGRQREPQSLAITRSAGIVSGHALGNAPDRPGCRRPFPGAGHILDRSGKRARPDSLLGALVVPDAARADSARPGHRDHNPAFLTGRRPSGLTCACKASDAVRGSGISCQRAAGSWCNMASCGNQLNNRRLRARHNPRFRG